jgi:hypothetical protein
MVVLRPDLGPRRAHGDVRMGTGEVTLHPGELATVAENFQSGSIGGARPGAVQLKRVCDGMLMRYFDQADLCLAPANSNQQSTPSSNPAGTGMEMRCFAQTDLCAAPANEHQPETSSNPTGSIYHPQLMQPMQPAASMLTPMASVVVEIPQTLDALLTAASLDHVRAPLMDLGVVEVADFADVTDKDLQDCGLKTIEIKRLRRHLAS